MSALNQILEVLLGYVEAAKFWTVVYCYEAGVILRLGKYHRTLGPGFHWKAPFIDTEFRGNVVPSTFHVGPMSLTTKDGHAVVLAGVVTWSIGDIKKFLLEVEDAESVIEDSCYGTLGDMVRERDWDQLIEPKSRFRFFVEKRLITTMKRYGVVVEHFQFSDLSRSRTIRLLGWGG